MRTYPNNSPQAAARLLALTIIADGGVPPAEISTSAQARILELVPVDEQQFKNVLHDLCDDLLATTYHGVVQIETELIDRLLMEITYADLRRSLWTAMWQVADADGWLADAEAVLLSRAAVVWRAETGFTGPGGAGHGDSAQPVRR